MPREVAPVAWYRQPAWLGLVGLALMVGGWKLGTYVPQSPRDAKLAELRGMSEDPALTERLDRVAGSVQREPPYRIPGRLAVLAGFALFAAAAVGMYRAPPPREVATEPEGEAT